MTASKFFKFWLVEFLADGGVTCKEHVPDGAQTEDSGIYLVKAPSEQRALTLARRIHSRQLQMRRLKRLAAAGLCRSCAVRKIRPGICRQGPGAGRAYSRCIPCQGQENAHRQGLAAKGQEPTVKGKQNHHDERVRLALLLDVEHAAKQHADLNGFLSWIGVMLRDKTDVVDRLDAKYRPRRHRDRLSEIRDINQSEAYQAAAE